MRSGEKHRKANDFNYAALEVLTQAQNFQSGLHSIRTGKVSYMHFIRIRKVNILQFIRITSIYFD